MTALLEPTEPMIEAGCLAWLRAGGHDCDSADLCAPIYIAMERERLASAPQEPDDDALIERLQQLLPTLAEQWPHAELIVRAALTRLQAKAPETDYSGIVP